MPRAAIRVIVRSRYLFIMSWNLNDGIHLLAIIYIVNKMLSDNDYTCVFNYSHSILFNLA